MSLQIAIYHSFLELGSIPFGFTAHWVCSSGASGKESAYQSMQEVQETQV